MNFRWKIATAAIALAAPVGLSAAAPGEMAAAQEPADIIFTSGDIKTPTGWADAMAVKGAVIQAVGKAEDILRLKGAQTQVIDVKGQAVLPGLHDSHVHVQFAGIEQFLCGFPSGAKPDVIAATVKNCAAGKKPGEWVHGGNWIAAVFKPGQMNKQFLDRAAPNNPVALTDEAHHSIWTNSKGLALAGITKDTPNPEGGVIERDKNGEPTGLLRETAQKLVDTIIPTPTVAQRQAAVILSTNQMLSFGITSFTDALVTSENIGVLSSLAMDGRLKQRTRGCILWTAATPAERQASEALIANRNAFSNNGVKFDCVKIVLDGVPTDGRTAAMLDPYIAPHGAHSDGREKGILMIPQPTLNEAVAAFDRQGLTIKFHAAGDAAVRSAIDAVEYARKVNGPTGPSHDLGHDNFVNLADFPRARALNLTWEFSPYVWYPTPVAMIDVRGVIGDERMKRWTPIKDGLDSGSLVVAGSDWSVVPSVNPWLAIETMVTRQVPGGSKVTLGEAERVSLDDAIKIFTINGATHQGQRDHVGSIEPGMEADIIVLDRNPFKVPITQVHSTKVQMTFIAGKLVYDIKNPPVLTAK